MATPHIPCLRLGDPYVSLNQIEVTDYRDGAVKATVSQVNAGVIRRDLERMDEARAALCKFSTAELIAIERRPVRYFSMAKCKSGSMEKPSRRSNTSRPCPPPAACRT